jgi:hypothetical protein
MVGGIRADRAIVMGDSIRMVMKCKSQDGERKAYEQETDKPSFHNALINQLVKKSKWGRHRIYWQDMLYF